MHHFGQWIGLAGENISYGIDSPRGIVMSLIIDEGVGDRVTVRIYFTRSSVLPEWRADRIQDMEQCA